MPRLFGIEMGGDFLASALGEIDFVGRERAVVVFHEDPVFDGLVEAFLGDAAQEYLGVVSGAFPEIRIQAPEKPTDLTVPAVEVVVGELLEA